ncbi:uncharacterized protein BJ171DRAFT_490846, partial [Polychytrium aggregatum]|uniref:uncharacterized protein n=1 Tax=Polychytrium aggregatum TaxID=110093 RepID=UPI0022FE4DC8
MHNGLCLACEHRSDEHMRIDWELRYKPNGLASQLSKQLDIEKLNQDALEERIADQKRVAEDLEAELSTLKAALSSFGSYIRDHSLAFTNHAVFEYLDEMERSTLPTSPKSASIAARVQLAFSRIREQYQAEMDIVKLPDASDEISPGGDLPEQDSVVKLVEELRKLPLSGGYFAEPEPISERHKPSTQEQAQVSDQAADEKQAADSISNDESWHISTSIVTAVRSIMALVYLWITVVVVSVGKVVEVFRPNNHGSQEC